MDDGPVFPEAPPERVVLADGFALVRPRADLVPSAVRAINESLDHLRPWMAWAQEPNTEAQLGEVYREAGVAWDERRDFLYLLLDPDGEVAGGSGLHPRLGTTGLEIGYWIRADLAGRGMATELTRALTTTALAVPGVERVRIQCTDENVRSSRVPAKLGYQQVDDGTTDDGRILQRWVVERSGWPAAHPNGGWPVVLHLVGRPAAGKRTVALGLEQLAAEQGRTLVLLDNHRTGNLVLSLVGADGRSDIASEVWDRVIEVRDLVYRTVEELSPPAWSFVVTNVLLTDDPRDHAAVARIRAMAEARGSAYLPVHVRCDRDVLLERVPRPERQGLHKWIDPEGVAASFARELLVPEGAVELDTTHRSPQESARWLLRLLTPAGAAPAW